jgi:phosphatidylinositol glycan class V
MLLAETASSRATIAARNLYLFGAALCFAGAASARSNGVLLAAYLLYAVAVFQSRAKRPSLLRDCAAWGLNLGSVTVLLGIVVLPYSVHCWHAFALYCGDPPAWMSRMLSWEPRPAAAVLRPWCDADAGIFNRWVPGIYGYVQVAYWNNGFMRTYGLNQIPQLLLASPMLALACWALGRYVCTRERAVLCCRRIAQLARELFLPRPRPGDSTSVESTPSVVKGDAFQDPSHTLPYLVHWWALVAIGATFMHVQVTTRFVAACPALYWFMAHVWLASRLPGTIDGRDGRAQGRLAACCRAPTLLLVYCIGYTLVGTMLFLNFYDWT